MDSDYYSYGDTSRHPGTTAGGSNDTGYNYGTVDPYNPSYSQPVYTPTYHMPYYESPNTPSYQQQQQVPPPPHFQHVDPPSQFQQQQQRQQQYPPPQMPQSYHVPPQQNQYQQTQQPPRPPQPYRQTDYVDPYTQLPHQRLHHNDYNSYIRPLEQFGEVEQAADGLGYGENGHTPRRSPVETSGLVPIPTSRIDEPSKDPKEILAEREAEERTFVISQAPPGALDTIKVGKEKGPSARRIKKLRKRDEKKFHFDGPKPEQIKCGWSEYQGGATWQDINRYREHELDTLKQVQQQQATSGESYYYY